MKSVLRKSIKIFLYLLLFSFLLNAEKNYNNDLVNHNNRSSFDLVNLRKSAGERPECLDHTYTSENGRFKFHYTLNGNDAISSVSTNPKAIPDWIYEAAISAS